jgi:HTH-type transcriptional regulator/antitoxin HigA
MSLAVLDERRYSKLLSHALPRVIRTDSENARRIRQVENLDKRWEQLTPEEKSLSELLTVLIERYESEKYPINFATPQERLAQLMEDRGMTQADIWKLFGTRARASEVLNRKRGISREQARRLADFFQVPLDIFL